MQHIIIEYFRNFICEIKEICNTSKLVEKYHCNYGFNPQFVDQLKKSELKVSGLDENNEIRIIEIEAYPFFITALFQPERSALAEKYHPIINSFVNSAVKLS